MTATATNLTVRGDGEIIGYIPVGSSAVLWRDETWHPTTPQSVRRHNAKGSEWWQETITLDRRLLELAGNLADQLYARAKDCEIVTIKDEHRY